MRTFSRVPPPHLHARATADRCMGDVCMALLPPCVAAVWYFGTAALWRLLLAAVASLAAGRLSARRTPDLAALVSGLLVCLSCPSQIPLWLLVGACFFAVCLVRDGGGGIGYNLYNPAMAARAVLLTVFPAAMGSYALPDSVSAATPLAVSDTSPVQLWRLFIGQVNGSMGETSALLILLGLCWLLFRRVVRVRIPLLAAVGFSAVILLCGEPLLFHLLSGSFLFACVYIFTDYTTKPATALGEAVFAVGVGALSAWLRLFGPYPEGVCFAVVIVNIVAPLIEELTIPKAKEVVA